MFRALVPSGAVSFTLAPCLTSALAVSRCAFRTANSSGVNPFFDFALTSAPNSISNSAAPVLPSEAANISAVCPRKDSRASTFAPRASRVLTASTLPLSDAVISAVWPSSMTPFGSAPASRSLVISRAFPLVQAMERGVIVYRVAAFTLAPAEISASAVSKSSRRAAQWSAVDPSASAAFTSTPCAISAHTVFMSACLTASISGVSAALTSAAKVNSSVALWNMANPPAPHFITFCDALLQQSRIRLRKHAPIRRKILHLVKMRPLAIVHRHLAGRRRTGKRRLGSGGGRDHNLRFRGTRDRSGYEAHKDRPRNGRLDSAEPLSRPAVAHTGAGEEPGPFPRVDVAVQQVRQASIRGRRIRIAEHATRGPRAVSPKRSIHGIAPALICRRGVVIVIQRRRGPNLSVQFARRHGRIRIEAVIATWRSRLEASHGRCRWLAKSEYAPVVHALGIRIVAHVMNPLRRVLGELRVRSCVGTQRRKILMRKVSHADSLDAQHVGLLPVARQVGRVDVISAS